jgi:hypothetical protein
MQETVTISLARFEELIRDQRDANLLKSLIETRKKAWRGISHEELEFLYDHYFFPDEELKEE